MRTHIRIRIYLFQELLISFIVGFLFFFVLFFVNILLVLAEQIFSKDVPLREIALLLIYSTPQVLSLTFPFAALIGSLMAMGRLASDNELLALRASGVPLRLVFRTIVLVGMGFSALSFVANDYLLPAGSLGMNRIYRRIVYTNPGIDLEEYSINRYQEMTIVTGSMVGAVFHDFTVFDNTEDGKRRSIFARSASLREGQDTGVLSLELHDVLVQLRDPREAGKFEYTRVESMLYNVPQKDIQLSLVTPGPREMSSVDVWAAVVVKRARLEERQTRWNTLRDILAQAVPLEIRYSREVGMESMTQARRRAAAAQTALTALAAHLARPERDRSLEVYIFEFHKKFSLPVACLIFFIFAYPVGLLARKSGRAVGFGVGLLVSVLYWGLLVAGQSLTPNLPSPAAAAWLPDVVVLALALGAAGVGRRVET